MKGLETILSALHQLADTAVVDRKALKYNIRAERSLGIYQKDLKATGGQDW